MNLTNSQVSYDSEDNQLSLISPYNSHYNDILTFLPTEQVTESFIQNEDALQDNDNSSASSPGRVAESFPSNYDANDATYAEQFRSQHLQAVVNNTQNQIPPVHPTVFFYRPPNDFYHYRVTCEKIPYATIESLLKKLFNDKGNITQFKEDECIFCYQQKYNDQFYKVSCKIISPLLINNCLSE